MLFSLSPFSDLHCMFKLFARVDGGLQCIVKCVSGHLRETGRSIVADEPGSEAPGRNATTYIQNLLQLHDQYAVFLEQSFENGQLFKHAIQSVSVHSCTYLCETLLSQCMPHFGYG